MGDLHVTVDGRHCPPTGPKRTPTPASEGDEPRAASPVATAARVRNTSTLADLPDCAGAGVRVELD